MSFAKVWSIQHSLLKAHVISVEVDLSKGLHLFSIVGLPDKGVEESRDRVSAAIKNSGFKSPKQKNQKIVISLAPADLRKEGPIFDLAIAMAYLLAAEEIRFEPKKRIFLGELSLDGSLQKIKGVLPQVVEAKRQGFTEIYLPKENEREAALIKGISIFGATHLREVIGHVNKKKNDYPPFKITPAAFTKIIFRKKPYEIDFADIKGQETAKRGLEIAAAGGHNIALYGPPGTGKTMLARAFVHLLPTLTFPEILETTSIHSVAGILKDNLILHPPFRSPHHTASYVAMVGGGAIPKPGEVTLAHRGVLFLDEFPEFDKKLIESLRQPLEDHTISVSRARGTTQFPAKFILIATMNPCPCGNYGIRGKVCECLRQSLERYHRKISGPIIDRIDMWIEVGSVDHKKLSEVSPGSINTNLLRDSVKRARSIQQSRFKAHNLNHITNSEMTAKEILKLVPLDHKVKKTLNNSALTLDLSARSYHRVIKLARTIADLENKENVGVTHILEALQYRPKKKEF
jgi:magnesium chelatase family protein